MLTPQAGDNVLEIGVSSGYSGAFLAHLVGPSGRVTAVLLAAVQPTSGNRVAHL